MSQIYSEDWQQAVQQTYYEEYINLLAKVFSEISQQDVQAMTARIVDCSRKNIPILVCGNGGSAAIVEHMACDHTKGVACDTNLKPFFIPLASNVSMITAIANDIAYDQIFAKQIEWFNGPAAVLVISSSGNSPNIINALLTAKQKNYLTMAMVGFDGGKIFKEKLADVIVHSPSNNYGVVEDSHQSIMHIMAQNIRIINNKSPDAVLKL